MLVQLSVSYAELRVAGRVFSDFLQGAFIPVALRGCYLVRWQWLVREGVCDRVFGSSAVLDLVVPLAELHGPSREAAGWVSHAVQPFKGLLVC